MAITAPTVTGDFDAGFLPPEIAAPIFEEAARMSVVQSLTRRVPLADNGVAVPVVTGRLTAGWTAEGASKHVTEGAVGLKTIKPEKLTAIAVVSAETVRRNPAGYVDLLRPQMAEAFAVAFDYAALHDLGGDGTGTGPFTTHLDQTTKSVELGTGATIHTDLTSALSLLVNDGKRLTGFAIDDRVEPLILGEVDTTNRPLYTLDQAPSGADGIDNAQPGRLLNRPSFQREGVATPDGTTIVGFAGNWRKAVWGAVGGIEFSVSEQASVTINGALVSTWENNLVAIRAEAYYGFLADDVESFVKLTNAV